MSGPQTPPSGDVQVAAPWQADRTPELQERYRGLRRWNVGIGLFHLTQAIVLLLLSHGLALPVVASFAVHSCMISSAC